jgi:hypothetical protein
MIPHENNNMTPLLGYPKVVTLEVVIDPIILKRSSSGILSFSKS